MANSTVYTSAAVLFVIVVLFSITIILNSVDKSKLLATPGIPIEKATRSSFGSSTIHASVDEVFSVLMNFKDYNKWSLLKDYRWEDTTADGVPLVGSEGSVEILVEGFTQKRLPVKFTVLDRERKMIAERTTSYPSWLLSSERVQEVVPIEGSKDTCEYRTWQTLEGFASYLLLLTAGVELDETFKRCANNLKDFIEKR